MHTSPDAYWYDIYIDNIYATSNFNDCAIFNTISSVAEWIGRYIQIKYMTTKCYYYVRYGTPKRTAMNIKWKK